MVSIKKIRFFFRDFACCKEWATYRTDVASPAKNLTKPIDSPPVSTSNINMLTRRSIEFAISVGCDPTLLEFCDLTLDSSELSIVPFHRELQAFCKKRGYVRDEKDSECWNTNCDVIHNPSVHAAHFMSKYCDTHREPDDNSVKHIERSTAANIAKHFIHKHGGSASEAIAEAAHTPSLASSIGVALAAAVDENDESTVSFLEARISALDPQVAYDIANHAALRAAQMHSLDAVKSLINKTSAECKGRIFSVAVERSDGALESFLKTEFPSSCLDYDEALRFAARHHSLDTIRKIMAQTEETVYDRYTIVDNGVTVLDERNFRDTRRAVSDINKAFAESVERSDESITEFLIECGHPIYHVDALRHAIEMRMSQNTLNSLLTMLDSEMFRLSIRNEA